MCKPTEARSHIRLLRCTSDARNHTHMLRPIEALAYFTHGAYVRLGLSMYTVCSEPSRHRCTHAHVHDMSLGGYTGSQKCMCHNSTHVYAQIQTYSHLYVIRVHIHQDAHTSSKGCPWVPHVFSRLQRRAHECCVHLCAGPQGTCGCVHAHSQRLRVPRPRAPSTCAHSFRPADSPPPSHNGLC